MLNVGTKNNYTTGNHYARYAKRLSRGKNLNAHNKPPKWFRRMAKRDGDGYRGKGFIGWLDRHY